MIFLGIKPGRTWQMKYYSPLFIKVFLFAAFFSLPVLSRALEEGKPMPLIEVVTMDGKSFKSTDAKGDVVVINLWATWCSFCRTEMPALETYYQRHRDQGLRIIAVSMDDASAETAAREVMKAYGFTGGIGRSSNLKALGRIWRLPMTFVIDRDGILRRDGSEGDPEINLPMLEKQVTPLLAHGRSEPAP
jgi:peroxiredoxin